MGDEALTRLPYLQVVTPTGVTVRWRTIAEMRGRVWYGQDRVALTSFADAAAVGTEQEVRITGLQPNTRYYYGVGDAEGVIDGGTAESFFVTSPIPGRAKRTRLWALGDSGTGSLLQKATRDAYYEFTGRRGTDLLLLLGDNAYRT
jgi:acid phosphatase type 7